MRSKFLCAFIVICLSVPPVFASSYEEHEKRFEAFGNSIDEAAKRISWSSEYNLQDVEFVRNEMLGDETVYARAWYDDYYLVIRRYRNNDWSNSFVSNFWTGSEELTFTNGIKVGSSFSELISYFGAEHLNQSSPTIYSVFQFEEEEEEEESDGVLIFTVEDNIVKSIAYTLLENQTSKMNFLFNLHVFYRIADITGEKVNVRDAAPDGKVKFQVSRSKGDRLLVYRVENEDDDENGWYYVEGRIVNNSLKTLPRYYISKRFVKTRKLTPSERKLFISQYRK